MGLTFGNSNRLIDKTNHLSRGRPDFKEIVAISQMIKKKKKRKSNNNVGNSKWKNNGRNYNGSDRDSFQRDCKGK